MLNKIDSIIINQRAREVFGLIRRQGKVTKNELSELTGSKMTTLTRILDELLGSKLIMEVGFGVSQGGRKPILYSLNPHFAYVIGLDISRTYSKLVLCDFHLNVIDSLRWSMTKEMTPPVFIKHVEKSIQHLLMKHKIDLNRVLGMGIGSVGPLDRTNGMMINPLHFPTEGWKDLPIRDILQDALQFPVVLDNGANTGLLAEYWLNNQVQSKQLVYIHVGIGIRSSVISADKIFYGALDMEGSIGQMIIQSDGHPPLQEQSGNYGALESYTTIPALEKRARSLIKKGRDTYLTGLVSNPDQVNYQHLLAGLKAEDPLTKEIFLEAATYFGIGLANLLNILHPEKIILGGPLITSGDLFYHTAIKVAEKKTYYYPIYKPLFAKSKFGEEGIGIGAAAMVIGELHE